jgi:hypothetical protein
MASFFSKMFSSTPEPSPESSERLQEYEQIFKLAKKKNLSAEKKAELEALYTQLIRKSDNVTSGQLQFLGLAEIRDRMGASKWARLQSKVYATAESVINNHISISDIHFLFKEDRYVIIFTQSTDEEINRKVATISDEIMRRLAELDEEELQSLQIQQEIKKVDVETFLDNDFNDMLDYVFKQYNPGNGLSTDTPSAQLAAVPYVELSYSYIPLWDTDKKAMTAFLCMAYETETDKHISEAYKALFQGKSLLEKTAFDIRVLEKAIDELEKMEIEDRKRTIICPVQHETIYNFNSYDEYKNVCQMIPNGQRHSLIFLVTNSENFSLPAKDPYWFIPLLKDYCGGIYIEIPMRETMVYQALKDSGANGLGIQLTSVLSDEEKNLDILLSFNTQAKLLKIKKTFALNIDTEHAAKKLARIGFHYLGGPAIYPDTLNPDPEIDPIRHLGLLNLAK